MPTSLGSDLVPARKETKRQLESVKGRRTYDDVLRALLQLTPPDVLAARLRMEDATMGRVVRARSAEGAQPSRSPEKQLLIAELAEARWARWLADGRVARVAPRRYAWRLTAPEADRGGASIVRRPGRGLPPREGPRLEG